MAKRFHESYAGMDSRRAQEHKDGEMIGNSNTAFANMPQEVVMKYYNDANSYLPENLNDGGTGIDAQLRLDNSKKNAKLNPKKV